MKYDNKDKIIYTTTKNYWYYTNISVKTYKHIVTLLKEKVPIYSTTFVIGSHYELCIVDVAFECHLRNLFLVP